MMPHCRKKTRGAELGCVRLRTSAQLVYPTMAGMMGLEKDPAQVIYKMWGRHAVRPSQDCKVSQKRKKEKRKSENATIAGGTPVWHTTHAYRVGTTCAPTMGWQRRASIDPVPTSGLVAEGDKTPYLRRRSTPCSFGSYADDDSRLDLEPLGEIINS